MKKINEDVVISDPTLAQQYANGQTQIINNDKKINALQMQINKIEQLKVQISKKMAEIEQKAAQNKGTEKTPEQTQSDQAAQAAQIAATTAAQVATQANITSESLLIKVNENLNKKEKTQLEIDQLTDHIVYLSEHNGSEEEIGELKDYNQSLINSIDENYNSKLDNLYKEQDKLEDELANLQERNDPNLENDIKLKHLKFELREIAIEISKMELYDDQETSWQSYQPGENPDLDQHLDFGESPYSIDETEEEELRFTQIDPQARNYDFNKEGRAIKKHNPIRKQKKPRPWSYTKLDKYDQFYKDIQKIEYEIEDIENQIEYELEKYQSPSFEGIEGEIEEFWGSMPFEQMDILNSGEYKNDKEKIAALKKAGAKDPTDILQTYYYYFPEYDPSLIQSRKETDKEIKKLQGQIEKCHKKIEKKKEQQEKMGIPIWDSYNPISKNNFYNLSEAYIEENTEENDWSLKQFGWEDIQIPSGYEFSGVSTWGSGHKSPYINKIGHSKGIMITGSDEMGYELFSNNNEITDTALSKQEALDKAIILISELHEAYIEMEDEKKREESKEDYLDKDYVFYVKINEEDNEFIGKIFKISPDGDWYGIIKKGDDESFEKISYEPEYDEIDIVEFLGDSYDKVEIIDIHEFNNYIEEMGDEYKDDPEVEESWPTNSIASS